MTFLTPQRVHRLRVNAKAIVSLVEETYGYVGGTLLAKSREAHVTHPRHLAAFLLVENGLSNVATGKVLGLHHTTVLNSRKVMATALVNDREVQCLVELLRAKISGDPGRYQLPKPQLHSTLRESGPAPSGRPPRKPAIRATLPNVASGTIKGMEEIDRLIVNGRGDTPRLPVELLGKGKSL